MAARWSVLAVAAYGQFGFSAFILGMGAAAPLLQTQFGLTLPQIGVLLALTNVGPVLSLVGWGLFNDRWGERRALIVGLSGCALALAAAATVDTYLALCVLVLLASGLGSTSNVSTGRAVMATFQPPLRGLALGLRQTAAPVGGAMAGFAIPRLAAQGMGPAFGALAGVVAFGAVASALWLGRMPQRVAPVAGEVRPTDPRVWRMAMTSGILLAPQAVYMGLTAVMLTQGRGMGPVAAGAVLGAVQVAGAVLRAPLGYLSDRWGHPVRTLRRISLFVAAGTLATGLLFGGPLNLMIIVVIGCGSLAMSWNSISFGLVADYGGEHRSGYALGLHATMLFLAAGCTVPLFAALVDATSWSVAFVVLTIAPAAAWLMLRPLRD